MMQGFIDFAFRLNRIKKKSERLVFDPEPVVLRRGDIPGGLDRRYSCYPATYYSNFLYYHRLIARYRPVRFFALYPLYLVLIAIITVRWIWKDAKKYETIVGKVVATLGCLVGYPIWFCFSLFRLFSGFFSRY